MKPLLFSFLLLLGSTLMAQATGIRRLEIDELYCYRLGHDQIINPRMQLRPFSENYDFALTLTKDGSHFRIYELFSKNYFDYKLPIKINKDSITLHAHQQKLLVFPEAASFDFFNINLKEKKTTPYHFNAQTMGSRFYFYQHLVFFLNDKLNQLVFLNLATNQKTFINLGITVKELHYNDEKRYAVIASEKAFYTFDFQTMTLAPVKTESKLSPSNFFVYVLLYDGWFGFLHDDVLVLYDAANAKTLGQVNVSFAYENMERIGDSNYILIFSEDHSFATPMYLYNIKTNKLTYHNIGSYVKVRKNKIIYLKDEGLIANKVYIDRLPDLKIHEIFQPDFQIDELISSADGEKLLVKDKNGTTAHDDTQLYDLGTKSTFDASYEPAKNVMINYFDQKKIILESKPDYYFYGVDLIYSCLHNTKDLPVIENSIFTIDSLKFETENQKSIKQVASLCDKDYNENAWNAYTPNTIKKNLTDLEAFYYLLKFQKPQAIDLTKHLPLILAILKHPGFVNNYASLLKNLLDSTLVKSNNLYRYLIKNFSITSKNKSSLGLTTCRSKNESKDVQEALIEYLDFQGQIKHFK